MKACAATAIISKKSCIGRRQAFKSGEQNKYTHIRHGTRDGYTLHHLVAQLRVSTAAPAYLNTHTTHTFKTRTGRQHPRLPIHFTDNVNAHIQKEEGNAHNQHHSSSPA